MRIIILGKPEAQQRHRDRKYGGKYDPQSKIKGPLGLIIKSQIRRQKLKPHQLRSSIPLTGAISVVMRFYMPIPKSTSKKKALLMEVGQIHHTKKPDSDNMTKFYYDVLKGIAWKDDSQVVHSDIKKMYSRDPRVEILVTEVL